MVLLVLMLAVLITPSVGGGAALSPLPVRGGCFLVSPEVNVLRLEGEAIILSFPMFERVLEVRNIAPPTAKYLITKGNGTQGGAYHGEGRVQQRDNQLWLLPAQAADSGEYICTYRNETYCVTGSIGLHVYQSGSAEVEKLSYPIPVSVGESLRLSCPSLGDFNSTDRLIEWHKDSGRSGRVQGSFQQARGRLLIPAVRRSHAGVYTCRLRALIDDQQYKVSRTVVLNVEGVDPVTTTTTTIDPVTTTTIDPVTTTTTTIDPVTAMDPVTTIDPVTTMDPVTAMDPVTTIDPVTITTTEPDLSGTSDPGLTSSSFVSVHTPGIQPPVILSPRNGTIFESLHGSGLELSCTVLTECQTADYTVVTWLVNNQSVESSYLDGRALQGGRRVTAASEGCHVELRLVVVTMTDEDVNTELRCVAQNRAGRQEVVIRLQLEDSTFTWLLVAAATVSCFLTVVSVFLYVLFKPNGRNKADYFLARQNSSF